MTDSETLRVQAEHADRLRAQGSRQLRALAADAARMGLGLRESARALGRSHPEVKRLRTTVAATDSLGTPRRWMTAREAATNVEKELATGDEVMAFRMIVQARDHLRSLSTTEDIEEWGVTPMPLSDTRWDTLLRAVAARTLREMGRPLPTWTRDIDPLPEAWLVLGLEHRRKRTAAATPPDLADLGILLTENDLVTM